MNLKELRERVNAATGPDRELNHLITQTFGKVGPYGTPSCAGFIGIASFTSSTDAALALVDRVLPTWYSNFGKHSWGCSASLYIGEGSGRVRHEAFGPTRPLAILAAILATLIAQADTADDTETGWLDGFHPSPDDKSGGVKTMALETLRSGVSPVVSDEGAAERQRQ